MTMSERARHFFGDILSDDRIEDRYIDMVVIPAKPRQDRSIPDGVEISKDELESVIREFI